MVNIRFIGLLLLNFIGDFRCSRVLWGCLSSGVWLCGMVMLCLILVLFSVLCWYRFW